MRTNHSNCGFTLIELMIVVAIIGILAAIAIPAYSDYVISAKLTQATSQLSSMRARMEQYYQDNRDYTNACNAGTGILPATDTFAYTCPVHDQTHYTLQATGQATAGLNGFVFTIDQNGTKTTAATLAGWNSSTSCWVTKKGGAC